MGLANVMEAIDAGADPSTHRHPSQIVKAGRRLDLHAGPADLDAIRERADAAWGRPVNVGSGVMRARPGGFSRRRRPVPHPGHGPGWRRGL